MDSKTVNNTLKLWVHLIVTENIESIK